MRLILFSILVFGMMACNQTSHESDKTNQPITSETKSEVQNKPDSCINESNEPNIYILKVQEKYGIINNRNEILTPLIYDHINQFSNGFAQVGKRYGIYGLWLLGYINMKGEEVIPCKYIIAQDFNANEIAIVEEAKPNNGYHIINSKGDKISDKYSYIEEFADGIAAAIDLNNNRVYLNTKGEVILKSPYYYSNSFSEGLACVRDIKNKTAGFMDLSGNLIIPFKLWGSPQGFSEGLSVVQKEGEVKYGYSDKEGNIVIDYKFDFPAESFQNGMAVVAYHGKSGVIDKTGNFIIQPLFDHISSFKSGYAIVGKTNMQKSRSMEIYDYGYINMKGELIINYKYEFALDFENGRAVVVFNGEKFEIDTNGNLMRKLKYCPISN